MLAEEEYWLHSMWEVLYPWGDMPFKNGNAYLRVMWKTRHFVLKVLSSEF